MQYIFSWYVTRTWYFSVLYVTGIMLKNTSNSLLPFYNMPNLNRLGVSNLKRPFYAFVFQEIKMFWPIEGEYINHATLLVEWGALFSVTTPSCPALDQSPLKFQLQRELLHWVVCQHLKVKHTKTRTVISSTLSPLPNISNYENPAMCPILCSGAYNSTSQV